MDHEQPPRTLGRTDAIERARLTAGLLGRHGQAIHRTALRFSLSPEDAEDAYQRAAEILLRKAPLDGRSELEMLAWARLVARREAMAISKRRRAAPAGTEADAFPVDPDLLVSRSSGPLQSLEDRERVAIAASRLATLKPQERRALALQGAGCSYADIQAITGWTYTKVNRCLAEGRAALRQARGAGAGPISRASPRTSETAR